MTHISLVARVVNAVIGIIEVILLLRVGLELLGANPATPFVAWIYNVSAVFIAPFIGVFPGIQITQNSVLDIVAIIAMVGYAILGWLLIELVYFIFSTLRGI